MIRIDEHTFEPAVYADEELVFLLDHLEQSPTVALHKGVPKGVNPIAIRQCLMELQEFHSIAEAHKESWAGFEAVKDSIIRYLAWRQRSDEIYRRTGGPRSNASIAHPSQYAWDSAGGAFKFGIDADSAEMVRNEILEDGSRKPFGVRLNIPEGQIEPSLDEVAPWIRRPGTGAMQNHDEVVERRKQRHGSLTCTICDKSESFDTKNPKTHRAADARMRKHLKTAREDVARHRLLYRTLYESPTARA